MRIMRLFTNIVLINIIALVFLFTGGCGDDKSPNSSSSVNQAPQVTGHTLSP